MRGLRISRKRKRRTVYILKTNCFNRCIEITYIRIHPGKSNNSDDNSSNNMSDGN